MNEPPVSLDSLISYVRNLHPEGDPLERLADAVVTASEIGDQADALIGYFVDQARGSGASWSQIGDSIGVSKQAAQKRFVARSESSDPASVSESRFTPRARLAIRLGRELTGAGDAPLSAAAIIAGIVAIGEGVAALAVARLGLGAPEVCAALGVDLSSLQKALQSARRRPGRGRLAEGKDGEVPNFSPEAKDLLGEAVKTALHRDHNYIGTEHLLLAAVSGEGALAEQLAAIGLRRELVEEAVTEILSAALAMAGVNSAQSGRLRGRNRL